MHAYPEVVRNQISPAAGKNCYQEELYWGNLPKRVEQMYPVYETGFSVRRENEALPSLPKVQSAARISKLLAQLEELLELMNLTFYGPLEPHLWLVGNIALKTWENCRETSER